MVEEKVHYRDGSDEVGNISSEPVGEKGNAHETGVSEIAGMVEKFAEGHDVMAPMDDVEYVMDKIAVLTVDECKQIIRDLLKYHEYDYNFSTAQREKLAALLKGPAEDETTEEWELDLKTQAAVNKFYSPYPEVRAVTTPVDDPDIPCETIRAHLLGYLWAVIAQFTNSLFNSRFPTITLTSAVAQIFLYPCGKLLEWVLPDWGFTYGGKRISLNPGPWTYKVSSRRLSLRLCPGMVRSEELITT